MHKEPASVRRHGEEEGREWGKLETTEEGVRRSVTAEAQ